MRYPILALIYLLSYVGASLALRGYPFAHSMFAVVGILAPAAGVIAIILRRRRQWAGCQRLFWDTIAIGITLWFIGHLGWAFGEIVEQNRSWLQWHTLFSLMGGAGPLVALLARPHRGVRAEAVPRTVLDIASYSLLLAFVYTFFIMIPSVVPTGGTRPDLTLQVMTAVFRTVLLVALVATAWIARGTEWQRTFQILAAGVAIGLILRIDTSLAILRGSYNSGTIRDLAWVVPFLCYGYAAFQAPVSSRERERLHAPTPPAPALVSAVPVLLIPLIGYAWLRMASIGDAGDSFRALLTSLMTVGGLGLLTMRLSAQGDELQRSDAKAKLLAAATEQTGDLILITRENGAFEHANEAFLRAMGYSRDELASLHFADLIERGLERLGDHISAEVRTRGIWRGTLLRRRRDGSTFPAGCTVVGLKDGAGAITHFVGVERDITEELQLRDQLVHSERLSAVGELVAGVAHEMNNPLQTIVGCTELMLDERTDPALRRDLELVRREAARAGQIVRNLLSFVRRSAPDRAGADLNQIVRATVELREYHLEQQGIFVTLHQAPGPLPVLVNREEIQQVVLNLLLNAEQAIAADKGGGSIAIRTSSTGRQQIVEVTDDGPGISPELRGRIFEPFFTTKDVGQGTGLGLSISHGIASAHGGSLELCGAQNGACFRLTLPAHAEAAPRPSSPAQAAESPMRRALVVDDQAPIRNLLARLLERRGFEVLQAESGAEALAAGPAGRLAVVLCDIRMPGMDGVEVYRRFLAEDARIGGRFVFITGDMSAIELGSAGLDNALVLAKPFTATDLDAVLAKVGAAVKA